MASLTRIIRYLLPVLAVATLPAEIAHARIRSQLSVDDAVQQSALIAHVRIAGAVSFRGRDVQVVEIIDAARGPAIGQLAMIGCDRSDHQEFWSQQKVGQQFILFAEHSDDALYQPLADDCPVLTVTNEGTIADRQRLSGLYPPQAPPTAAGVMAHLRAKCRRQRAELRVRINGDDVAEYEWGRPLRVEITIKNTGEETLSFQNYIEYEYHHNAFVGDHRLEQLQEEYRVAPVKICVRPVGRIQRELHAMEEMVRRLSDDVRLAPGQRAIGSYDLGEEFDIEAGGNFLVWAEWGGQRSPDVLLQLPEKELEEIIEKAMELAEEEPGPFTVDRSPERINRDMPPVEPIVHGQAIDAALSHWFSSRLGGRHHALDEKTAEVIVLRSSHITPEFAPSVPGVVFLSSEARWYDDGKPAAFKTSRGPVEFHWRTVRIKSVDVEGANATVEIIQNERHNLGGAGATIKLRRSGASWRIAEPIVMWQS